MNRPRRAGAPTRGPRPGIRVFASGAEHSAAVWPRVRPLRARLRRRREIRRRCFEREEKRVAMLCYRVCERWYAAFLWMPACDVGASWVYRTFCFSVLNCCRSSLLLPVYWILGDNKLLKIKKIIINKKKFCHALPLSKKSLQNILCKMNQVILEFLLKENKLIYTYHRVENLVFYHLVLVVILNISYLSCIKLPKYFRILSRTVILSIIGNKYTTW